MIFGDLLKIIFKVLRSFHFEEWYQKQDKKTQGRIEMRLDSIEIDGHFGRIHFFDGIIELKWRDGLRVYTARLGKEIVIVLIGGTKHGQGKDIKKAKKILKGAKSHGFDSP